MKVSVANVGIAIAANVTMLAPSAYADDEDQAFGRVGGLAGLQRPAGEVHAELTPQFQSISWNQFYPHS